MSGYLLDTNICVHLIKGEFGIKERIARLGVRSCFLSEITIAELLFGVENSAPERQAQNRQNLQVLQTLFEGRILRIGEALPEYARQKVALRRRGRTVDEFDLLIGATAIVRGLTLVSRNTKHFADLAGIELENWVDQS
ncbi:type II toxin-antitoxin system VapC family toxin [Fibrella forsythiae]|uniref:Ribonuclease VapC n=1 Tax=Fibrella forsythiae TaxID=2817061 RepID=A0ABS3JSN0_9BACT|nr:type II toxin-antitoxin system VapC family toxin [Fibrella forsythiae]MBO0953016.1 type II toxin-antitoxin system VapC family toxin [Fibrella forsythiae]